MILVDSSVWVDHLRSASKTLYAALDDGRVLGHPFVAGEVALGSLKDRAQVLELLQRLPQAPVATHDEVLYLIERHHLHGRGIGWVDAHLLAGTLLSDDGELWTRDKRLAAVAGELGIDYRRKKH